MIVLCSDTRLDYGDLGSTNTTVKLDILGNGWCTQLAGEWSGVVHLRDILKARVYGRRTTLGAIEDHTHFAVEKFLKSPFYSADGIYELLISGFSGTDRASFWCRSDKDNQKLSCETASDVLERGSGCKRTFLVEGV